MWDHVPKHSFNDILTSAMSSPDQQAMNNDGTAVSSFGADDSTVSFVNELKPEERSTLELELRAFVVRHASHHRPIAFVTSGGTAADLEINSVRCLDNFSTGLRGAISAEEFLKRGYAVLYLCRVGSASPYARVVAQSIGLAQANHGLNMASLGKLFATGDEEESKEDQMVQKVLDEEHNLQNQRSSQDPWMTAQPPASSSSTTTNNNSSRSKTNSTRAAKSVSNDVALHRRLVNSSKVQTALQERSTALKEGRLLTVPFRSVEEYLAKLQLCSESLRDSQSLAILYLAAAVSDFYIPISHRSQHKIQSHGAVSGGLTLHLHPVPKVLGLLRTKWAPDAFLCSFKLETDKSILRHKAERAVRKYGCHMVIGNLLQTRHSQVWVLAPSSQQPAGEQQGNMVENWPLHEITKPKSSDSDALESLLIDHVVQTHFEYISLHHDKSGAEAMVRAHEELARKKHQVQQEIFWKSVQRTALEWAGVAVGAVLSYVVSAALRRRMSHN
jgi:phosphopantothenate---cysteine ligase (ATP)